MTAKFKKTLYTMLHEGLRTTGGGDYAGLAWGLEGFYGYNYRRLLKYL